MKFPFRILILPAALLLPGLSPAADELARAVDAEFQSMDANHNGRIAPAVHAKGAKKMFDTMDADHDGKVTAPEMDVAHEKVTGHKDTAPSELTSAEKIRMVDTNRDGVLTATEHSEGAKKMFALMDLDTDGNLTKDEVVAGHQELLSKDDK
jgi:Ca2+-binding EF-hand superfamily protein